MANLDDLGQIVPSPTSGAVMQTMPGVVNPYQTVAPSSGLYPNYVAQGSPTSPYTAPATNPSRADFNPFEAQTRTFIENSPQYKQGVENAQRTYDLQNTYAHNVTGLQDVNVAQREAEAARLEPLKEKQIKETLGGRGLISSGQTGLELGEAQHTYQNFLRDLKYETDMRQQGEILGQGQRDTTLATARYTALMTAAKWFQDLWWDPTTGVYQGPGAVDATAPAAAPPAAPAPASAPAAQPAPYYNPLNSYVPNWRTAPAAAPAKTYNPLNSYVPGWR